MWHERYDEQSMADTKEFDLAGANVASIKPKYFYELCRDYPPSSPGPQYKPSNKTKKTLNDGMAQLCVLSLENSGGIFSTSMSRLQMNSAAQKHLWPFYLILQLLPNCSLTDRHFQKKMQISKDLCGVVVV